MIACARVVGYFEIHSRDKRGLIEQQGSEIVMFVYLSAW